MEPQTGPGTKQMVGRPSYDCWERSHAGMRKELAAGWEGKPGDTKEVPIFEPLKAVICTVFGAKNVNKCPFAALKTPVWSPTDKGTDWRTFCCHECSAGMTVAVAQGRSQSMNFFVSEARANTLTNLVLFFEQTRAPALERVF